MTSKFLAGITLALLAATSFAAAPEIPKLDLKSLEGESLDLDHYVGKGRWTLVMFWATDCGVCKQQKPLVSAFHNAHKDSDAQVVGVAIDGYDKISDIRSYLADHQTSFPTLVGELPVVAVNYELITEESFRGTPTYMLFKPDGELVGINPGAMRMEAVEKFINKTASAADVQ